MTVKVFASKPVGVVGGAGRLSSLRRLPMESIASARVTDAFKAAGVVRAARKDSSILGSDAGTAGEAEARAEPLGVVVETMPPAPPLVVGSPRARRPLKLGLLAPAWQTGAQSAQRSTANERAALARGCIFPL